MPDPDPLRLLGVLERHKVRFVLTGTAAARIGGAPVVVDDIEVAPATDGANLERLAAALKEVRARLRRPDDVEDTAFPIGAKVLRTAVTWTSSTSLGDLDISFAPSGTRGYPDLRREASRARLARGLSVTVASLRDVIRSKEAAGRDKDLAQLPLLRRTLELTRQLGG